MSRVIYPGSFDPITNGHLDVIERAVRMFDQITIAVLRNPSKEPLFSVNERMIMIRDAVKEIDPDIKVDSFSGLLVHYAVDVQASIILRGLRAVSDFEFEFQLSLMNRRLNPAVQTVYLMSGADVTYLSSGLVKEIARLGGDVSGFVPEIVSKNLATKFTDNSSL